MQELCSSSRLVAWNRNLARSGTTPKHTPTKKRTYNRIFLGGNPLVITKNLSNGIRRRFG